MRKRKPILFIDDGIDSKNAIDLFEKAKIDFVVYYVKKFEECNCDKIPVTTAPSIFAPEGIYKEIEGVEKYITFKKNNSDFES